MDHKYANHDIAVRVDGLYVCLRNLYSYDERALVHEWLPGSKPPRIRTQVLGGYIIDYSLDDGEDDGFGFICEGRLSMMTSEGTVFGTWDFTLTEPAGGQSPEYYQEMEERLYPTLQEELDRCAAAIRSAFIEAGLWRRG